MKVLLAIDGTTCSDLAVRFVTERAYKPDDQFLILAVVESIPSDLGFADAELARKEHDRRLAPDMERMKEVSQKAADLISAAHPDHTVTARVECGTIVDTIVETAEAFEADLIILGSHGRQGFERFFIGSVAEEVLRRAHCSVEVVKGSG
ncbi:MAG: universal stress protein [Cyanobacteria bacterium HKST-UBA01]|nr:universal stress protein [Cyanobacteria bacterium HKST-UBA01]